MMGAMKCASLRVGLLITQSRQPLMLITTCCNPMWARVAWQQTTAILVQQSQASTYPANVAFHRFGV